MTSSKRNVEGHVLKDRVDYLGRAFMEDSQLHVMVLVGVVAPVLSCFFPPFPSLSCLWPYLFVCMHVRGGLKPPPCLPASQPSTPGTDPASFKLLPHCQFLHPHFPFRPSTSDRCIWVHSQIQQQSPRSLKRSLVALSFLKKKKEKREGRQHLGL